MYLRGCLPQYVSCSSKSTEEWNTNSSLSIEVDGKNDAGQSDKEHTVSTTVTTAHKLREAVIQDVFPTDPLTREHFGFSKVDNQEEETCILGLYDCMFRKLRMSPSLETVQGWVTKNKLAAGIYHTYKSNDADSRYFKWFKKNRQFFDQNYVNPRGPKAPLENGDRLDVERFKKLTM